MRETVKDKLKQYILDLQYSGEKYIKTSTICRWQIHNFTTRGVRSCQDMAQKGELLQRISKQEAILLGFSGKEGVWEIK